MHRKCLCEAVCVGLIHELKMKNMNLKFLMKVGHTDKIEKLNDEFKPKSRGVDHE